MGDIIGSLAVAAILIVPVWKIFGKAGFTPALSLLLFVPYVGIVIAALLLAFRRWPSTQPVR